jgi:hypothetical protein
MVKGRERKPARRAPLTFRYLHVRMREKVENILSKEQHIREICLNP